MVDFIKNLFTKEWDFDDKILIVCVTALAGIVIGILFSPIKQGFSLMSHNGCNNTGNGSYMKEDKKVKGKKKELDEKEN